MGDRLFTDMVYGNLIGAKTVLCMEIITEHGDNCMEIITEHGDNKAALGWGSLSIG